MCFTACGRTLLGLSLILFSQSSMSRLQLMSMSSLTAKFACKFTYFGYFAYTQCIYWLLTLSLPGQPKEERSDSQERQADWPRFSEPRGG